MARYTGKNGKVTVGGGEVAQMMNWKIDSTVDVVDATAMQDTWRQKLPTFMSWKGSAEFRWTADATLWTTFLTAASVALVFYFDKNVAHYFSGSAFVNFSFNTPFDNVVTYSCPFEGTDTLSYT
jgi:predicted secreted protein